MESRRIKPYIAAIAMIAALSVAACSARAARPEPPAQPLPILADPGAWAPITPVGIWAGEFSWGDSWGVLRSLLARLRAGRIERAPRGNEERDPAAVPEPTI